MPPVATHPGSDYFVNLLTGTIQRQSNPLLQAAMRAGGFSGPFNWAFASQLSNDKKQRQDILGATPGPASTIAPGAGAAAQPAAEAGTVLQGLPQIGAFFSALTQGNTWLRVGEVVAGLLLLYVGLNALAQNTAAGNAVHSATQTARKGVERAGMVIPK